MTMTTDALHQLQSSCCYAGLDCWFGQGLRQQGFRRNNKLYDMMKVEQIRTADDVERYIEGCLNDYEAGVSTKEETLVYLAELVAHVYAKATEEKRIITTKQDEKIYNSRNQRLVRQGDNGQNDVLPNGGGAE